MQGRQLYSQLASFGWNQKWNGGGKGWAVGGGGVRGGTKNAFGPLTRGDNSGVKVLFLL